MSGFAFHPSDIQAVGVGLAAFFSIVLMLFVFLSARNERLGRPMWIALGAAAVWASFGFLYHVVSDLSLARDMRVLSVMGIVFICMAELNFATVYLNERVQMGRWALLAKRFVYTSGSVLVAILCIDLVGGRFIVGDLLLPPDVVLAPTAGPLMIVLIAFYALSVGISAALIASRARHATDESDRTQAVLLFVGMTVGLTLGGLRFTPWFGFDFYPLLGDVGFPLFTFAVLYSIKRYHLLNLQVIAAQILIFLLWTFTFFRILLDTSFRDAVPDIGLFIASVVLGILLLRSTIAEMRSQKELAKLTIDRAKSEFITIAAHQLRTPASALRWSFNLLQENNANMTEAQRAVVKSGNRAAENMAHIIGDLLDMGRIADGKFRYSFASGDIARTLRESADQFKEEAGRKRVALDVRVADALPFVFDESKISLAVQNLIDNAITYTPADGRVTLEATGDEKGVRITVADTGIGFTKDESERVFEKFFRGSRAMRISPDGSGLGLVISKTIVEGHGGTMTFVSEEGKGTTFTIALPRVRP